MWFAISLWPASKCTSINIIKIIFRIIINNNHPHHHDDKPELVYAPPLSPAHRSSCEAHPIVGHTLAWSIAMMRMLMMILIVVVVLMMLVVVVKRWCWWCWNLSSSWSIFAIAGNAVIRLIFCFRTTFAIWNTFGWKFLDKSDIQLLHLDRYLI